MAWKMDALVRKCPCLRPKADDVRVLDYRHCSLVDVPNEIFNFERTLEELYLDSNQIHDLPRPLFHCHELHILGLSDNEVQSLPPAIASLINLEELDICKNAILDIPDNIKGCKSLRILDASVNPLGKLPEGFTQLINLEELYLNDTFVDFLPASFGRLSHLRVLELRENHLKSLPKSISRLMELSRLDIGQNHFRELPEVIGSLPMLSELWCDCNRISSLPMVIGNLLQLKYLDASQNRIEEVPHEIVNCSYLTDITLSSNNLKGLPDSFGYLKSLAILRLDDNKLKRLPNSIGNLSNLEELILSQNDLADLPYSIGFLRKMHTFIVDDNLIEELPAELGSCVSMTILSIRNNRLKGIPDELGHIPHLRILNLSSNQIRFLPFSITKLRDLQALWLSENQNKPLIPLQGDIDIDTGQRVLTCYALPQVVDDRCEENLDDSDSFRSTSWEEQRQRRQHIKFAFDEKFDKPGKLVRNPTPYPKELKSHVKHSRNQALKNKSADYVNVSALDSETGQLQESGDEFLMPVVQEAKILPSLTTVMVKEARVMKPSSPGTSPKLHDRHLLFKCDKEKNARDKARFQRQVSTDGTLISDSQSSSPASLKSAKSNAAGALNMAKSHDRSLASGKYSSLPELANGEVLSSLDKDVKTKYNASRLKKKLEDAKQGRINKGLLNQENGYRSDYELYANVALCSPSGITDDTLTNATAVSDGYASDRDIVVIQRTNEVAVKLSPSVGRGSRFASVSSAVARKLNNGTNSPGLQSRASSSHSSEKDKSGLDFIDCDISSSPNVRRTSAKTAFSSALPRSMKGPSDNVRNRTDIEFSRPKSREQYGTGVPRESPPGSRSPNTASPIIKPTSSPKLPLSQRNRLIHSVPVTRHSPPALPPRTRPSQTHPSFPNILNTPISPRSQLSAPASPSLHHSQKPPPYHIAAAYSKHIGDSSPGSSLGHLNHYNHGTRYPFPPSAKIDSTAENLSHINYLPPSIRCGGNSPPTFEPRSKPGPASVKSSSRPNQHLIRQLPNSKVQRPHCSDMYVQRSQQSNPSSPSHLHQQTYGSVNGAVVYGNPYTTEHETVNTRMSPSPGRSPRLHSRTFSTGKPQGYSRQSSPHEDTSLPNGQSSVVRTIPAPFNSHNSPRLHSKPNLQAIPLSSPLTPRSSSAPSTPPLGDRSPTNLPPYRTPPLYQSISVGNLHRTNKDGSGIPTRVAFGTNNHEGNFSAQPLDQEPNRSFESSPMCESAHVKNGQEFSQMEPDLVGLYGCSPYGHNRALDRMGVRGLDTSRSVSQNNDWMVKVKNSPTLQRATTINPNVEPSGIFTARPAMADVSDRHQHSQHEFQEVGARPPGGLLQSSQTNSQCSGTVLSNPYVKSSRHPPNLTQDKPTLDGVSVPLVVPTPQRPITSTGHIMFAKESSEGNDGNAMFEPVKNDAAPILVQHSVRKPSWLFGRHHNPQVIPLVIQKNPDLGFTIAYKSCNPANPKESAIYVDSVARGGAAYTVLKTGDRLLQVDGTDFTRLDLSQADRLLHSTGPTVFMMVSRNC